MTVPHETKHAIYNFSNIKKLIQTEALRKKNNYQSRMSGEF